MKIREVVFGFGAVVIFTLGSVSVAKADLFCGAGQSCPTNVLRTIQEVYDCQKNRDLNICVDRVQLHTDRCRAQSGTPNCPSPGYCCGFWHDTGTCVRDPDYGASSGCDDNFVPSVKFSDCCPGAAGPTNTPKPGVATPTPIPITVQGFKVREPGGVRNDPSLAAGNVCLNTPAVCSTNNPYFLNYSVAPPSGTGQSIRTVTGPPAPAGYTLMGSTLCYNDNSLI